jgi:RNA polymerase sigma-70 factor (ECF subfamily)
MEGWLSRIATNAFLDDVRRRARRPTDALPDDDPERVLPTSEDAAAALAREQLPSDVQAAITALPPEYRAAVVLSDVVGLSYQEIADHLEVPVGTVRSRIHRGRARLRERLT